MEQKHLGELFSFAMVFAIYQLKSVRGEIIALQLPV
jgi:hypothetical protein